ncbi:glycosyl hydrolase family 95 catalytic domain-containing protein [Solitalea lacus]|uniref:glycosyl hydrolase family 95 catalytic domain-containing protein n=1 Tax=Solitalea lacus TaxID=2911172 RepID=UPI001ED9EC0C|nr:hypothetical protein [Solitalea lacus]UKJ07944.1 hypothetical protein L2B55_01970 [Solitalea lacus]
MNKKEIFYFLIISVFLVQAGFAQSNTTVINWQKFLSRNDLVFDTLTTKWEEGVFTGNGLLGAMLYMKDSNALRLEVGRTDVVDGREGSPAFQKARLPIGHFELRPEGKIIKNTARLYLWNAEANGTIVTDKGTIQWRTYTLSQMNVIVFETKVSAGERKFQWQFHPEVSISGRTKFRKAPNGYVANPPSILETAGAVEYCKQPMLAGGDYTTAWAENNKANSRIYYLSVAINRKQSSADEAVQTVSNAAKDNLQQLLNVHRQWWHHYYPQSFISLPDARMESFYWIQQYKLASATREGKPALDLMGPWYRHTPWPAYWFNLNIQLTYSPLYAANQLELANGLVKMIDEGKENLSRNVPAVYRHNALALGRAATSDLSSSIKVNPIRDTTASESDLELGNLTWCLYNYWLQYRYSMDESVKTKLFPLLKGSINYYLDVMRKEEDGKWHLPHTYSPEYPGGTTRDCNYDLSLFRWGCETLLKLNPSDSLASRWKDVLINLTDYPTDTNGLRIGRDVAFNKSHRHYSHMLMIHPLCIMNWEQPENRPLIEKSLQHWLSLKSEFAGFSFTGSASIHAVMGQGDKALDYLNQLFGYTKPNTMYLEEGPVIETPLAAATSIQELLLQSWGDKIRIFPAVPSSWKDLSFENLRTEGAFLISAVRKDGETKWVKIKSLAGEPCIIRPNIEGKLQIKGQVQLKDLGNDTYSLQLKKGEEVVLYRNASDLLLKADAVKQDGRNNYWGKH